MRCDKFFTAAQLVILTRELGFNPKRVRIVLKDIDNDGKGPVRGRYYSAWFKVPNIVLVDSGHFSELNPSDRDLMATIIHELRHWAIAKAMGWLNRLRHWWRRKKGEADAHFGDSAGFHKEAVRIRDLLL